MGLAGSELLTIDTARAHQSSRGYGGASVELRLFVSVRCEAPRRFRRFPRSLRQRTGLRPARRIGLLPGMPMSPGLTSISSIRALPEKVAELANIFTVGLECARCRRVTQIYPGPIRYSPGLRIPAMMRGHSCSGCGVPFSHLVLSLAGRGIPFHPHNQTTQWVLDRAGSWTERRGEFWSDVDYDDIARRNRTTAAAAERLRQATLQDLEPDEVVVFTCGGPNCRHARMVTPRQLIAAGIDLKDRLAELAARARCTRCRRRSKRTTVQIQKGRG